MSVTDTDSLIRTLARQAGTPEARRFVRWQRSAVAAAGLALAVAVALIVIWFGARADLAGAAVRVPVLRKLASMLALAGGGLVLARRAARPGAVGSTAVALAPGGILLALGAAIDDSGASWLGHSSLSAPGCVLAIVVVSLPGLGLVLGALRGGAPTRPRIAGAAAGVLAGALGAAAYALACRNDGGLFVAIWYVAAVAVVSGLGALIGRRALAW
jgi:hypothetical protein